MRSSSSEGNEGNQEDGPRPIVMRSGEVPTDTYGAARLEWLTSRAANGAREISVARTTIGVGERNPRHRHPNCEEVLYVLSGEIEHFVAGTPRVRMTAGEAILVPRDAVHQAFNVGAAPVQVLAIFSHAERESVIVGEED